MANDFSAILPILQDSANIVGRELFGFIPSCYRNVSASRAGLNQTVNYPIVPQGTTSTVTPAATPPAGSDITPTAGSITMNNLKKYSWNWTGEQEAALQNGDIAPFSDIFKQTLTQGMRTLANEIEAALWVEAYVNSSRATGTAGTAPFNTASDMSDLANIRKILNDNGAPLDDRHLVLGSTGYANFLAKQPILFKANEAGSRDSQTTGMIPRIYGFDIRESFPIAQFTAGTNSGATTNSAGYAVGSTAFTLASAGTGTILAGDVVSFAGDTNKYVIKTGDADVSNGGTFALNAPGIRVAMSAATKAITTTASYTPNIALHRNGLHLVMRAPATGSDGAADTAVVTDEKSGLVFQLARYGQYMQSSWELRVLYGVKAANPHLIATLIG